MTRAKSRFTDEGDAQEIPSGTVNGSNTAFTLSSTPDDILTVQVFVDGLAYIYGVDYTVSTVNITMTTAPAVGQKLSVKYRKRL